VPVQAGSGERRTATPAILFGRANRQAIPDRAARAVDPLRAMMIAVGLMQ